MKMIKWIKNLLGIETLERNIEWHIERLDILESAIGYKVVEQHARKIAVHHKPKRYDEIERDRSRTRHTRKRDYL